MNTAFLLGLILAFILVFFPVVSSPKHSSSSFKNAKFSYYCYGSIKRITINCNLQTTYNPSTLIPEFELALKRRPERINNLTLKIISSSVIQTSSVVFISLVITPNILAEIVSLSHLYNFVTFDVNECKLITFTGMFFHFGTKLENIGLFCCTFEGNANIFVENLPIKLKRLNIYFVKKPEYLKQISRRTWERFSQITVTINSPRLSGRYIGEIRKFVVGSGVKLSFDLIT